VSIAGKNVIKDVANLLYPSAKEMFLSAQLDWLSDPIYAILIDTNYYTLSLAHTSLADVDASAFVVSSPIMTGRTCPNGVADAANLVFPATSGSIIQACLIVLDGGTALQSKLIAYIDTALNLPYNPDGRIIVFQWDDGPNRIFAL
jgi:hypothetical protein